VRRLPSTAALATLAMVAAGACAPDGERTTSGPTTTPSGASTPSAAPPSPTPTAPPTRSPTPTRSPAPDPAAIHHQPDDLTEVLVAAETAIRDPQVTGRPLDGWARAQQAAYRQLADRPDWHEPVAASVPAQLTEAVRRNLEAMVALRRLTSPRESLPAWRIVAPPPADVLLDAYRTAADEFGIDWTTLAAIHLVESRMGRIRGDSTAGAKGPMQFLPSTWQAYGEGDIEDPHDAIRAAARYLADHGAPQDIDAAIYAYNHSDLYVTAIQDHAAVMRADPRTYRAYHAWQVYYRLASGDRILEVGFDNT
jgi:soluble lytic murein transglycosylase-like protein